MHILRGAAAMPLLVPRDLDYNPPPARTAIQDNPSLLVSWWVTIFSLTIILFRLGGRWIRTERLFLEDKIMALSIIPLLVRMGFTHLVLRNGTNNTVTAGLSAADIANREYGSQMVLGARIFYAMFLWTAKLTVTEFLHRLCETMWKRSWTNILNGIRAFLLLSFIGVVISTLAGCQPFDHYWQVVPDPGTQCRQAYAQLFTMGGADMATDVVLVAFPVYIVFQSNMRMRRKLTISMLFAFSLLLVGIASYRIAGTLSRAGSQPFRSLIASVEILAATFVANALVLGSFMRDKGVKKAKFDRTFATYNSGNNESVLDRPTSRTRPRGVQSWGSDTDLAGDIGMRFKSMEDQKKPVRPAPVAICLTDYDDNGEPSPTNTKGVLMDRPGSMDSDDISLKHAQRHHVPGSEPTPRRMSFFDVGGLLDEPPTPLPMAARRPINQVGGGGRISCGYSPPDLSNRNTRPSPPSPILNSLGLRGGQALGDDDEVEAFALEDFTASQRERLRR